MKAKPLADYILVQENNVDETTKMGIILSATAQTHRTGKAIKVGPGLYSAEGKLIPMQVKKNDTVYYTMGTGIEVKLDGTEYRLIREGELLMVE